MPGPFEKVKEKSSIPKVCKAHLNSGIRCGRISLQFDRGDNLAAVYPPCTSNWRFGPFERFCRFAESISYVLSKGGQSSTPPASTTATLPNGCRPPRPRRSTETFRSSTVQKCRPLSQSPSPQRGARRGPPNRERCPSGTGVEGGASAMENMEKVNLYEFVLLANALLRPESFGVLVRLAGFEPATFCSGGKRSIHLSYRRMTAMQHILHYIHPIEHLSNWAQSCE